MARVRARSTFIRSRSPALLGRRTSRPRPRKAPRQLARRLAGLAEEKARERRERAEEERQRREQEAREAAHRQGLHDDLLGMANDWKQANIVRAFLAAVEVAVRVPNRGERFRAWLHWATEHVAGLDPLNAPQQIGKALEPPSPQ